MFRSHPREYIQLPPRLRPTAKCHFVYYYDISTNFITLIFSASSAAHISSARCHTSIFARARSRELFEIFESLSAQFIFSLPMPLPRLGFIAAAIASLLRKSRSYRHASAAYFAEARRRLKYTYYNKPAAAASSRKYAITFIIEEKICCAADGTPLNSLAISFTKTRFSPREIISLCRAAELLLTMRNRIITFYIHAFSRDIHEQLFIEARYFTQRHRATRLIPASSLATLRAPNTFRYRSTASSPAPRSPQPQCQHATSST